MQSNNPTEQQLSRKLKLIPVGMVSLVLLLLLMGIATLYSAAGGHLAPWALRHIYTITFMLPFLLIIILLDLQLIYKFAYHAYFACLVLLVIAEIAGYKAMGAQRWLRLGTLTIQPSELCKIGLILALSRYFHSLHSNEINKLRALVAPILITLLPTLLVLKQPNLGTAVILLWTGACIFFVAGVPMRFFATAAGLCLSALPVAWMHLHDYQKKRIFTFLYPENDPLGAGYNIMQSKIAIGSGGIMGKGFMAGSQSQLSFLPEKQTDFIFTVFAEEWGFVGVSMCLLLYLVTLGYIYFIALNSHTQFSRLIGLGVGGVFFIHIFINVAMISGLLPVVGTPLPFLSYGGSNLLTNLCGFALVANGAVHHKQSARQLH